MNKIRISIPTVCLALLGTACGNTDDGQNPDTMPTTDTTGVSPVPGAPSTVGPATVGPTGTLTPMPSTTGAVNPVQPPVGATGPGATGPGATGPGATGPGATGPGATGPGATGPGATGPGATGPGATGPGATGPGATGPTTGMTGPAPVAPVAPAPTGSEPGPTPTEPGPVPDPPEPEPTLIISGQNDYWQIVEPTEGSGGTTITVNANQEEQDWHGFGGTFNEAGWDALGDVSAEERDRAIKLLFHKTEGAGFTYGRIPIGSSDYGLDRYTLAETAGDFEMNSFSIERDKQALIPYIKAALAVKPDIKLWASPWTPPPWMKENALANGYDRGTMKSDPQTLGAHALYLARFVEEYAKEGIAVEHVQPQNEPGYQQDYPSCGWSPQVMTTYIAEHLGPLFAERLPETEIWLGTMSNDAVGPSIVSAVMGNATARSYVKGIGLQWGMVASASNYVSQYDVPVMQTEHRCGHYPWGDSNPNDHVTHQSSWTAANPPGPAPNDHNYGRETWDLIKDWIGRGVNSYLAWNMILDTYGKNLDEQRIWHQNALLVVDRQQGTLRATPAYYVFRHLAQYVEPGAVRVGTQGGDALAFKNPDGSIVTVVHNSGGQAAQTTVAVGGTSLQFQVPAQGWATLNWQP